MLVGIPAGLIAAALPPVAAVAMAPCTVGTRWVATVAYVAARLEPPRAWTAAGWLVVLVVVAVLIARRHWRCRLDNVSI